MRRRGHGCRLDVHCSVRSDGVSPINSAATKHGRDKSLWYRSGRLLVRWPYNLAIVAVVVAATVPFALHAFNVPTRYALRRCARLRGHDMCLLLWACSYNMLMDLPRGAVGGGFLCRGCAACCYHLHSACARRNRPMRSFR